MLAALPNDFASTREALRALACYVISPACKARTGRIGLRPVGHGFGTRLFDDGSRIVVHGNELRLEPGGTITITTLRAAAALVGVDLSPDPGVGHDLPHYEPDATLAVGSDASLVLGSWYALGGRMLDELEAALDPATVTDAQLWPEHFDFAVTVTLDGGAQANVGFSPGDGFEPEPYVYIGPHLTDDLDGDFWNAPFGAFLPYGPLARADDPAASALAFVVKGLGLLAPATPSADM